MSFHKKSLIVTSKFHFLFSATWHNNRVLESDRQRRLQCLLYAFDMSPIQYSYSDIYLFICLFPGCGRHFFVDYQVMVYCWTWVWFSENKKKIRRQCFFSQEFKETQYSILLPWPPSMKLSGFLHVLFLIFNGRS
jgi:hypothetical protein